MKTITLFKTTLLSLILPLLLNVSVTNAQSILPLPPHNSVYSSGVRGYSFTAPVDFVITGLMVPTEAGTETQNIQVIRIDDTVAVYPTMGTNFTSLKYIKGAPNGIIQNTSIYVSAGDIIGILGESGTSTSYTNTVNPYNSIIAGQTVVLNRLVYQGHIDVDTIANYTTESTGPLGRIEMYYSCIAPSADGIIAEEVTDSQYNFSIENAKKTSSYHWDFGDGSPIVSGAFVSHTFSTTGLYTVKATLTNSCYSTVLSKNIHCAITGLKEDQLNQEKVSLYPNPTSNSLTIECENLLTLKEITIYNFMGQKVYETSVQNQNEYTIDVSQLPTGIYSVAIETNQDSRIKKLSIQ